MFLTQLLNHNIDSWFQFTHKWTMISLKTFTKFRNSSKKYKQRKLDQRIAEQTNVGVILALPVFILVDEF